MFKITPIQSKNEQKETCLSLGISFIPDAFAYKMIDQDSGALLGMSQFEVGKNMGYIYNLVSAPDVNDYEAMIILGRATMNFIDLCGAHTCRALMDAGEHRLLVAIGFKQDGCEGYECDMTGMFDGNCSGHH